MMQFLVKVALDKKPEMAERAPAEAEFVASERAAGRIRDIYVTPDKTMTWHVIEAEDADAASKYIQRYPYAPWFRVESVQAVVTAL